MAKFSSGIGDYIHLSAAGYNRYGIYRHQINNAKNNYEKDSKGVVNSTIRNIGNLTSLSKDNIQKIENLLNSFFNQEHYDNLSADQKNRVNKIKKRIEEIMNQQFKTKMGEIDWSKGNVNPNELAEKNIENITLLDNTIKRLDKKGSRLDPRQVQSRINKLNNYILGNKKLIEQNTGLITSDLLDKLNKIQEEAYDLWGDLLKEEEKTVLNYTDLPTFFTGKKETNTRQKREVNLKNEINAIISELAVSPPINLEKGELMEYIVAFLPYIATGFAYDAINNDIMSQLTEEGKKVSGGIYKVGGKKEDIILNKDFFKIQSSGVKGLKKLGTKNFNVEYNIDDKNKKSQGKVDVIINWEGEDIKASVKNVSLKDAYPRIDILTKSNFLFMIQDVAPKFINHFLNLNLAHDNNKDDPRVGAGFYASKKMTDNSFSNIDFLKVDEGNKKDSLVKMKQILALKALTGQNYKRDVADIFIVNDNQTGQIKVYNMSDITYMIKKAQSKDLGFLSVNIEGSKTANIKDFNFSKEVLNEFCEKDRFGITRINNILFQLYQLKVSASIQNNALQTLRNS